MMRVILNLQTITIEFELEKSCLVFALQCLIVILAQCLLLNDVYEKDVEETTMSMQSKNHLQTVQVSFIRK